MTSFNSLPYSSSFTSKSFNSSAIEVTFALISSASSLLPSLIKAPISLEYLFLKLLISLALVTTSR